MFAVFILCTTNESVCFFVFFQYKKKIFTPVEKLVVSLKRHHFYLSECLSVVGGGPAIWICRHKSPGGDTISSSRGSCP